MKQKKFMDIVRLKEFDVTLEDGIIISSNANGFEPGDIISVQEKIDGSNASIEYDVETEKLIAYSRNKKLDYDNTLNGFWNYVQTLNPKDYADTPSYVIFGEMMCKNHIIYTPDVYGRWIVYDIYDRDKEEWLPQNVVRDFCIRHNLEYIHVLYTGEFTSWDDLKKRFAEKQSTYCDVGAEGFIVKNMSKINNKNSKTPFVLKIVNDSYSEISLHNHIKKVLDPQQLQEQEHAKKIVDIIVTKRRIEKELLKMRDENILPSELCEKDMKIIAQNLPKRIYEDCVKEEKELVENAGQFFNKFCNQAVMRYAREIVLENS